MALTANGVMRKIAAALVAAEGRCFKTEDEALAFAGTLPFEIAGTYGGHSSCVELEVSKSSNARHEYVLCDLGSGARPFGNSVIARHGAGKPNVFHVFMSHLHWDHIMGLPLFTPAYIPGNVIRIYGCHAELEAGIKRQHGAPSFPIEFADLAATFEFITLSPDKTYDIAGLKVRAMRQLHAGDSYGYRFTSPTASVVYATDSEHKVENPTEMARVSQFFRDADLIIFDAMYSFAEAVSVKEDWGHSSNVIGVELCQMAGAKALVLFHHEPIFDDARIAAVEAETRRFEEITREQRAPLKVTAAYDGLEIVLPKP